MANISHTYAGMTHSPFLSGHGAKNILVAEVDVTADNLAAQDRWNFFKLPADTIVTAAYLYTEDLDSHGTPTLTLNLKTEDEDGNAGATILSADTTARTGGWAAADAALPVLTDAADFYVFAEVQAAPATAAAGKAKLVLEVLRTA